MPIASAPVSQNQDMLGLWISAAALAVPPVLDPIDGETCGIRRRPHRHGAAIPVHVVNGVRRSPAWRIADKVIGIDRLGFLTPGDAGVFEVANQFLLLGIYAYHRQARVRELRTVLPAVLELLIPVRMGWTGLSLAVGFQREFSLTQ